MDINNQQTIQYNKDQHTGHVIKEDHFFVKNISQDVEKTYVICMLENSLNLKKEKEGIQLLLKNI